MNWQLILVILAVWLLTAAVAAFNGYRAKRANERADASEARERALKRNVAHLSARLEKDVQVQKTGRILTSAIREAKTDEDAHEILVTVSAELDRLL